MPDLREIPPCHASGVGHDFISPANVAVSHTTGASMAQPQTRYVCASCGGALRVPTGVGEAPEFTPAKAPEWADSDA